MKEFSKLYEDNENQELSGESGFNIFLDIINTLGLLFIKHDYMNVGDYSYFFTCYRVNSFCIKRKRTNVV